MAQKHIIDGALAGHVVCNIGQINEDTQAVLNGLVRAGKLVKWRGRWFPAAGAPWGMGPLKTCYSTVNPYAHLVPSKAA